MVMQKDHDAPFRRQAREASGAKADLFGQGTKKEKKKEKKSVGDEQAGGKVTPPLDFRKEVRCQRSQEYSRRKAEGSTKERRGKQGAQVKGGRGMPRRGKVGGACVRDFGAKTHLTTGEKGNIWPIQGLCRSWGGEGIKRTQHQQERDGPINQRTAQQEG